MSTTAVRQHLAYWCKYWGCASCSISECSYYSLHPPSSNRQKHAALYNYIELLFTLTYNEITLLWLYNYNLIALNY